MSSLTSVFRTLRFPSTQRDTYPIVHQHSVDRQWAQLALRIDDGHNLRPGR